MADNAEKRCRAAMDKLFLPSSSSRPTTRCTTAPSLGVTKHFAESERSEMNARTFARKRKASMAPICRPWDRGDLVRRLASFKSITWFAKPKVISPVNCARRGWINVDVDTLACEVCGSRLLFSTPLSWTTQQVENSAAVFSLKLDSGHKTICPWKDNICDEHLAQFPPTPPALLVESFRQHCEKLACLSALPIVSSAATEYMKGPQIDRFLEQPPPLFRTLISMDGSCTLQQKDLEDKSAAAATATEIYYKAQKIISLCGWEPRVLPYVVDCEDRAHSVEDVRELEISRKISNEQSACVSVCGISSVGKVAEPEESSSFVEGQDVDPASVVLECKLCGACVGLWAFSTVRRPLQMFNLIKSLEVVKNQDTSNGSSAALVSDIAKVPVGGDAGKECLYSKGEIVLKSGETSQNRGAPSLNLTIAGGPPPTKQTFRPLVSLPIIIRHLRAGIWSSANARTEVISSFNEENQHKSQSGDPTQSDNNELENAHGAEVSAEETSKHKGDGTISPPSNELFDGHSILDHGSSDMGYSSKHDESSGVLTSQETHLHDVVPFADTVNSFCSEKAIDPVQCVLGDSGRGKTWDECAADVSDTAMERGLNFQDAECYPIKENDRTSKDDLMAGIPSVDVAILANHIDVAIQGADVRYVGKISIETADNTSDVHHSLVTYSHLNGDVREDKRSGQEQSTPSDNSVSTKENRDTVLQARNEYNVEAPCPVKSLEVIPWDKTMEFDPVRQHRHFCAWITSTGRSKGLPGWQQTLSALEQMETAACHVSSPLDSQASPSKYEGEDPVALMRKLLNSGSAKRLRQSHK